MSDRGRIIWLRKTMAAFGLLLFAITWRLWTPQTEFPQIPFFGWLVDVPGGVDWIALVGTFISLTTILFTNDRWSKAATGLFLISTSLLVLLNQHRLQPWVYLLLVTSSLLMCLPYQICLMWLRRIVISIYLYSAISKLDYQFVFTVGDQMLDVLVGFVGWELDGFSPWLRIALVLCLPIGELLVAVLLLFRKTAPIAAWLAIGLHVSLLLVLGPLGLNHQPSVLVWNVWFIVQAWLLFSANAKNEITSTSSGAKPNQARSHSTEFVMAGQWLAVFVISFPLTCAVSPWVELPIKADHWIAWEVYAPRSSRALEYPLLRDQPWDVQRPSSISANSRSLSTLGVPVYPQDRFQMACWMAWLESQSNASGLNPVVLVSSTANRWTGQRLHTRIDGPVAVQKYRNQRWFNTRSRSITK